jgi:phosphotransferase system enzyme I (PtsI)
LSASGGIASGPVFCLTDEDTVAIPRYAIAASDSGAHWRRFEAAVERARAEIGLLKDGRNREQTEILETHLMMLGDPEFIPQIKKALESTLLNIEAVLKDRVDEAARMLRSTGDAYLSERAVDIEDAFGRVMRLLLRDGTVPSVPAASRASSASGSPSSPGSSRFVPAGAILVARNLKPSEAIALRDSGLAGIALEEGGATSHVAILARAWRIPAVMGVRGLLGSVSDGNPVVLDADSGCLTVDPSPDLLAKARAKALSFRASSGTSGVTAARAQERAETRDGAVMTLRANIAFSGETREALESGAEGVGLFRSEFLFLGSDTLPDEETQYAAYRDAVVGMAGRPVVIRTLDSGGDKMIGEQSSLGEKNPLLGWRAVRYCLDRRDVFRTQLRALLRAGTAGDLRIMFPMISCVEELDAVYEALEEAKAELERGGVPFARDCKCGVMIEIPAAAVCADLLAAKADFMSIGTNDLTQYTMAVDRENAKVAHLFDCFNPAVLRLVKATLDAGKAAGVEVSMCGEMAGDPEAVFLLMGMGLRNFSMSSAAIPQVKALVRMVSLADAEELAEAVSGLSAAREIRKLVQGKLKACELEEERN